MARMIAIPVVALVLLSASVWAAWSEVPLAQWTQAPTMDTSIGLSPTPAEWTEEDGLLRVKGKSNCWDTRLLPGDQGPDTFLDVDFKIKTSSCQPRRLPGLQTARWAYHYGEHAAGWDFGVVLCWKDPLSFYRIALSAHRGELALWDSLGEFLQLVPCRLELDTAHDLRIVAHGPHFVARLDGEKVLDCWDRSQPHGGGQVGLAVWGNSVAVAGFDVSRALADPTPMPPHQGDFGFEQDGSVAILFDGYEPISRYVKVARERGTLFHTNVKLVPGGRTYYYTWYGPAITPGPGNGALPLVGELPQAFDVSRSGEELCFGFKTARPDTAKAAHECTVRFDADRSVYRYEYRSHLTFTGQAPFAINAFELIDPLTQNNRPPGPEVEYRWNGLEHRWHLYQGEGGTWYRYPLIDHLLEYGNQPTQWGRFVNVLYPDSAVCPAFELSLDWTRDPKRHFELGLCHWGYDFHHRERGNGDPVPPGHQRRYTVTFTGMPPSEAEEIFKRSSVAPKVRESSDEFAVFEPGGSAFDKLSTRQEPKSMTVWQGGQVDRETGREDSHSLRIEGPGKAWVQIYQHLVEANAERWWVRGWFKSKGVEGRGLQLRTKYSYREQPERIFYMGARGDNDWTRFSFVTDVFTQRDCTDVCFELDGAGQVWLDDVAVSALKPDQAPERTAFNLPRDLAASDDILFDLPMASQPTRAVYDASHNGHHLMLEGGPQWLRENGRGFLRFDGTDDAATIPLKPRLQPLDCKVPMGQIKTLFPLKAFSYEFWARPQVPAGGPNAHAALMNFRWNVMLEFRRFTENDRTCLLYYQNDRRLPDDRWQVTGHVRVQERVPYGQWLHIVATHADGELILYVNGEVLKRVEYDTGTPGFEFFMVGPTYHIGWAYGGGRHFRGDVGPMRLYAKALTAEEVAARHQGRRTAE